MIGYDCQKFTNVLRGLQDTDSEMKNVLSINKIVEEAIEIKQELEDLLEIHFSERHYREWKKYTNGEVIARSNNRYSSWQSFKDGILISDSDSIRYVDPLGQWHGLGSKAPRDQVISSASSLFYKSTDAHMDFDYLFNRASRKRVFTSDRNGQFDFRVFGNDCVVYNKNTDEFLLNGDRDNPIPIEKSNISNVSMELSNWDVTERGVLLGYSDWNNLEIRLHTGQALYSGEKASWRGHPRGFLIKRDGKIYLNNTKVLVDLTDKFGAEDITFSAHPDGVVVYHEKAWYFFDGSEV